MQIDGNVLIGYTDWERQKWHDWLGHHSEALRTNMGPHGDNQTVGDVVKHIFSAPPPASAATASGHLQTVLSNAPGDPLTSRHARRRVPIKH